MQKAGDGPRSNAQAYFKWNSLPVSLYAFSVKRSHKYKLKEDKESIIVHVTIICSQVRKRNQNIWMCPLTKDMQFYWLTKTENKVSTEISICYKVEECKQLNGSCCSALYCSLVGAVPLWKDCLTDLNQMQDAALCFLYHSWLFHLGHFIAGTMS